MNKDLKSLKNEITMAIEKIPTDVNVDDDYEMQSERASERSEYASYPLTVLLNSNIPLPFASPPPPAPPAWLIAEVEPILQIQESIEKLFSSNPEVKKCIDLCKKQARINQRIKRDAESEQNEMKRKSSFLGCM